MSRLSFAGSWIRFWASLEDDPEDPRLVAQFVKDLTVLGLELVAVPAPPGLPSRGRSVRWQSVEGRLRLLVRHLEEEKVRELLDVVAIREAIIAQDVAVAPQLLDQGC